MTKREAEAVQTAVQPIRVVVEWEGGKRYRGGRPGGPSLLLDGSREAAPGPVDGVIIALASCSAFDVVEILAKRRTPARSLRVTADYTRAEGQIPRRLTGMHLTFQVATDSPIEHVRRAVDLAVDKYCSVAASLAPDVRITADVELVSS